MDQLKFIVRSTWMLLLTISANIDIIGQDRDRKIAFPDVPGYVSLKCDLHIHTVFSDGSVWPDIRIQEAVKDDLDAISLTEHLEYQPHLDDIPHPDRNRSYLLAQEYAKPYDLMIIHGAEITKDMPPGHANALFINDANLLNHEDPLTAYRAAKKQGAFVFWNHPNWIQQQEDAKPIISSLHQQLMDEDLLHGIEVVNDITYSEHNFELAMKHGLTALGTSDIHGLIDWQFGLVDGGHRPITIVFAKERSIESIREALFAGRTASWFNDILIGKEEYIRPLATSSLTLRSKDFIGPSSVEEIVITNNSSARYVLRNLSNLESYNQSDVIIVEPGGETLVQVITNDAKPIMSLKMEVLSTVIGMQKHPIIDFTIKQ